MIKGFGRGVQDELSFSIPDFRPLIRGGLIDQIALKLNDIAKVILEHITVHPDRP
jgi:hypothetical protein